MTKMGVQFFGSPLEIIEFAQECANDLKPFVVVMESFPEFTIALLEDRDIAGYVKDHTIDEICFCLVKPNTDVGRSWDFIRKNGDCLSLQIGNYDNASLHESFLSAKTDDSETLKKWRKIARKLKKLTLTGGWIVCPLAGTRAFCKDVRYTKTAKALNEKGVKMRPPGGNHYLLDNNENRDDV